jgi:CheY-like chemotaxis protein
MLEQLHRRDPVLAGRKVLIVDDDVRNIFALTSALESHSMDVLHAENGQEGIDKLRETEGVEVVLMDIMMPGMDGYEAIREIRKIARFQHLPIIALTAKAMKADRDRCIEAGASDYISKPLDIDQLLSLLRVWLYRQEEAGA